MSRNDFNKALEWWLSQGTNNRLDIVKTARTEFGDTGFADIYWTLGEESGIDRIYPKGKGFEVVML